MGGPTDMCPLSLFALQRVHLDIQVGEHTNNYPEIAAKDKLTELQLRARQLLDQVEQIQKEQNYQRVRKGLPGVTLPPHFPTHHDPLHPFILSLFT